MMFYFNPGDLKEDVDVLNLQKSDTSYSWVQKAKIRAKAESMTSKNLFSQVGIGVKSVKFTLRKRDLTLHNAFRWNGKFCFLTDITEINRLYYEVTAAMVEPKTCQLMKAEKTMDETLHRPIYSEPQAVLTFPACLTEKYMGFQKLNPQSQVNAQYVLVTPKAIELALGDLVKVGETIYNVQIVHDLDEFKNEYEIAATKEA